MSLALSGRPLLESAPVMVTREVSASAAEVWDALTDPRILSQWLGALTAPLVEGQSTRLDFGDGDFFDLQDIVLDRPYRLQYTWRFLGIGPQDTITWNIDPGKDHCQVTVTDDEPARTEEASLQLRKGWLDFSKRLKDYLAKGRSTRYSWRRDFEGSIELEGNREHIWDLLFQNEVQYQWLPLDRGVLDVGAHFVVNDSAEPSMLRAAEVVWNPRASVSFKLTHPDWLHPTRCTLELSPRGHNTILNVSHNNWKTISSDKAYQKQQRQRFSQLWIATLQRARNLIA
jgi:uncharacterized protein YndB with AHSA1/START domain